MSTLFIGNKNVSSWSLRPWLALKAAGVTFDEVLIRLDVPETRASISQYSPGGKVPVLVWEEDGKSHQIWDSLAICEFVAEHFPAAKLWPEDVFLRAKARSYCAEMHSSFPDVRDQLSMFFARKMEMPELREATQKQIARIIAAWEEALAQSGGDFLFGDFSITDCMYAPVVSRFLSYGITLPKASEAYAARMMALPAMQEWMAGAKAEVEAGWR
ncbi:glutathione S-transferase [Rhizomicrobium palustre]|uniref:Glutathione S-transferase n=1 Tax=Rhizomicrobium palustre TaxID=189966 RepID=A0A846MY24_9PROT|nr:glutathione S-transferase family protein [Rhizomicrobium palustre]NIK87877.1 glutathione S-transferase [Rhizomicrobium palustre]